MFDTAFISNEFGCAFEGYLISSLVSGGCAVGKGVATS